MRPIRLLLLRHGQTTANVTGALDTAVPGPSLTNLGHRQAGAAAQALAAENYRAVYISGLIRTQQTAAPIAQARRLATVRQSGLEEIRAGKFEKRIDVAAVKGYLGTVSEWIHGNLDLAMPGSETGHEFLARYDTAIDTIASRMQAQSVDSGGSAESADGTQAGPAGGSALVVSHGAAIRTWVACRISQSADHPEATKTLHNTACITLEGHPRLGWELVDWHSEPIGGRLLEDDSAQDPTRRPVHE